MYFYIGLAYCDCHYTITLLLYSCILGSILCDSRIRDRTNVFLCNSRIAGNSISDSNVYMYIQMCTSPCMRPRRLLQLQILCISVLAKASHTYCHSVSQRRLTPCRDYFVSDAMVQALQTKTRAYPRCRGPRFCHSKIWVQAWRDGKNC